MKNVVLLVEFRIIHVYPATCSNYTHIKTGSLHLIMTGTQFNFLNHHVQLHNLYNVRLARVPGPQSRVALG
jgi:hypothetical protein